MKKEKSGKIASVIKGIRFKSFFWNAAYSGFNACQSAVILFFVARSMSLIEAGIISIGFAIANLASLIGRYGIRSYQVTDTQEQYTFSDYFHCRIVTCVMTAVVFSVYLAACAASGSYTSEKSAVILEIVILKLVDAFEGVYVGRLQQKGRLDQGAFIASFRLIVSTISICLCIFLGIRITISFAVGIAFSVLADAVLLPLTSTVGEYSIGKIDTEKIKNLIVVTFPLCAGTALHNYLGNAPKYLVDRFMNDDMQAIVGYVMMPMFVITLLNSFIMHPLVKELGDAWNSGNVLKFKKMCRRHIAIIGGFTLLVVLAGWIAGIPLLSLMYKVDLSGYGKEFLLFMAGGMFFTMTTYLDVILTTVRKLSVNMIGCIGALAVYLLAGGFFISSGGIMGASILYTAVNAAMVVFFAIYVSVVIYKAEANIKNQSKENRKC